MTQPRVAISILNYGGLRPTLELLESLKTLDYGNYDIWLVDCAVDIKDEISESIHLLRPGKNLGFSGGHDLVLNQLGPEYDYVLLLNNDTLITADFLAELVAAMESRPEAAAAGPTILYTKPKDKIWYAGGEMMSNGMSRHWRTGETWASSTGQKPREVNFITGCSLLMRLEAIRQIGPLDDRFFLYFEDADWGSRAIEHGWKLLYAPDSVIYHGVSQGLSVNSPNYLYYNIRNRLLYAKLHLPPTRRFLAWLATLWQTLKELVKVFIRYRKDYRLYLMRIFRAYSDYLTGHLGQL